MRGQRFAGQRISLGVNGIITVLPQTASITPLSAPKKKSAEMGRLSEKSKASCYRERGCPRMAPITQINAGEKESPCKESVCRLSPSCPSSNSWAKVPFLRLLCFLVAKRLCLRSSTSCLSFSNGDARRAWDLTQRHQAAETQSDWIFDFPVSSLSFAPLRLRVLALIPRFFVAP